MNDSVLLKLCGNSDYLMLRPVSRENAGKRKNFFAARSLLLRLENESEVILNDGTDLAIFRRSAIEDAVRIIFYWLSDRNDGTLVGHKEAFTVRYSSLWAFLLRCKNKDTKESRLLSIPSDHWPRIIFEDTRNLKKVVASRMLRRKLAKFLRKAFHWPGATEIRLFDDFLPYSFLFSEQRGDKVGIEGGVVLHNPDDPKYAHYEIHT